VAYDTPVPGYRVPTTNLLRLWKAEATESFDFDAFNVGDYYGREFDGLFTTDKPIIFNFHGYPWLIHKLCYRFRGHEQMHVRGYKEKGNINTPLELAILNETSRFNLVIDVIERVPQFREKCAHLKEEMKNAIAENLNYAHEHGTDRPEIADWTWAY
jgi:xylulose-5-phosphate/fructose-6-phosphate phosphoketolase